MPLRQANDVRCEVLINCAAQWVRQFGRLAGVNVPLCSAEQLPHRHEPQ